MVDFSKLRGRKTRSLDIDPLKLFEDLDKKVGKEYLWPPQEFVLKEWYEKYRSNDDTIIKLPTGHGKTLVGLLILYSSLKEGKGPALYLCPNTYLVKQTVDQAKLFGIKTVLPSLSGELPPEFRNSEAILVTTCQKLFNGFSKFGIASSQRSSIEIGALVMDDAHKCLDIIRESFSISVNNENDAYKAMLNLFQEPLKKQEPGTFDDLQCNFDDCIISVPFWHWYDQREEVRRILRENREDDKIKFAWNLIKNKLDACNCIFSGKRMEISPRLLPIELFPSFSECKRRIFLSATLTDDAFLIKDLGIDSESVNSPLSYNKEKFSGERLILIPSLIDVGLERKDIIPWIDVLVNKYGQFGFFSIVPSFKLAQDWGTSVVTNVSEIQNNIEELKTKINNGDVKQILVLVNQYDGIDLPDDICRILCLDSLPAYSTLADRYIQYTRPESILIRQMLSQKIEQGIGRSIRGRSDYSIVIIMGTELTNFMSVHSKRVDFSAETQQQILIGEELANDMKGDGSPFEVMETLISQFLEREEGWREYYKDWMSKVDAHTVIHENIDRFVNEAEAEKAYQRGQYDNAAQIAQNLADNSSDDKEKGWYLQQKAIYQYRADPSESMRTQMKAFEKNTRLFRPESEISYRRIVSTDKTRSEKILAFINDSESINELNIHAKAILDMLHFNQTSDLFEENISEIGLLLGFDTNRPEKMTGRGPDNLWSIGNNQYWIIECKNEVINKREISKKDTGQLNVSVAWFKDTIKDGIGVPVFIHPSRVLAYQAYVTESFWVMEPEKLDELKSNVSKLYSSIISSGKDNVTSEIIQRKLVEFSLDLGQLRNTYLKEGKRQ